jgi:two-component system heavy metal sensor histidine kinase CusS
MPRLSITLRLSLLFALLSTVVLAGTGIYLHGSLERQFVERDTVELAGKVDLLRHMLIGMRTRAEVIAGERRFLDALVGHAKLHVVLLDKDGATLFANTPLRLPPEWIADAVPAGVTPSAAKMWEDSGGLRYRTLTAWANLAADARSLLIALALDTTEQQGLLAAYRRNLLVVLLLAGVATAVLGFVVSHRGLRPLHAMAGTAYRISASHLNERLDEAHVPPELKQLAAAFNAMLARLEESFGRLASFSADLAHELRTPIHNLLMQTQVTLTRPRQAAEYREVLESNLEEHQRLARMIEDMLFLARADHAQAALQREPFELRQELDKVVEFYKVLAAEHGVTIDCLGAGAVVADRHMVQRAIGNLFSNAVRHTPRGGRIEAVISADDHGPVRLTVSNPGPGIPAEQQSKIFERFYRAHGVRSSESGGSGLGLAIVRSIMYLHGGAVTVESVRDGLTSFTLRFTSLAAVSERPARRDLDKATTAVDAHVTGPIASRSEQRQEGVRS